MRLTTGQGGGSGGQGRAPEPRYLAVGLVIGAHGVRGELKVEILTEDPRRFRLLRRVFLGPEGQEPAPWPLKSYRMHKGRLLLQLEGCDNRTIAESMRGYLVQVPLEEAIPLNEGEYYEHQILGLDVWTEAGEYLGQVVEILYTGANDVYVIQDPESRRPEILIPAIQDVVLAVDLAAGRLVVRPIEGL